MRAVHLAARLAGTDGVSLEATKVAHTLASWGFERLDIAGETETPHAICVPGMAFGAAAATTLGLRAFGDDAPDRSLETALDEASDELAETLLPLIREAAPDLLVIQNAWAIPMQLPLAGALARVVEQTGLPTLSHEHDYRWERERYARTRIPDWLDRYFPFDATNVRHLAINTPAAEALLARRGLEATVVPNVMDFAHAESAQRREPHVRSEVRAALGLAESQRLFLQPTRVVPRKGIHHAIELLARLHDLRNVLLISHASGDEGHATLAELQAQAHEAGVDLRYRPDLFAPTRTATAFALEDAYLAADFVTYPSLYEGFGNALLETVAYRRPALVNRYAVYVRDIAPTAMRFVEIDGAITDESVEQVRALLNDADARRAMTESNYEIAARHFGLPALRSALAQPLTSLGVLP